MALPAFTFDTHKFVRKLKGAGFNDQQAEALTDAVQESQAALNVATKADLEKLGTELHHEIRDLRKDNELLRKDMDAKFAGVDAKFELMSARFEKRLLILGVTLASITLFGQNTLSALLRLFH